MATHRFPILPLALGVALWGAAGCEMNGNGDRDDVDVSGSEPISLPERGIPVDRDRVETDRDGADIDRGDLRLPSGAMRVARGEDRQLSHRTEGDGVIYVVDEDENRIVYSTSIRDRERFVFDARSHQALVDGQVVFSRDLDRSRRYALYFDRD